MKIQNITQFANFISANNLTVLDSSLMQIIHCINTYSSMCDCYNAADKRRIYDDCNRLYGNAVRNVVPKLKGQFLSKIPERQISFYDEGRILMTLTH